MVLQWKSVQHINIHRNDILVIVVIRRVINPKKQTWKIKINAKITWAGIIKLRLKACKHVIEGLQFGLIFAEEYQEWIHICIKKRVKTNRITSTETCSPEACKLLPIQKQHNLLAKAQNQGTQCFWLQASLQRLISDTCNND